MLPRSSDTLPISLASTDYGERGALGRVDGKLPAYAAPHRLRRALNLLSRAYPWSVVWPVVGLSALLVRRPRRGWLALAPTLAGLLVIVVSALAIYAILDFAMPFVPAFMLLAAVGLAGERHRAPGSSGTRAARGSQGR